MWSYFGSKKKKFKNGLLFQALFLLIKNDIDHGLLQIAIEWFTWIFLFQSTGFAFLYF